MKSFARTLLELLIFTGAGLLARPYLWLREFGVQIRSQPAARVYYNALSDSIFIDTGSEAVVLARSLGLPNAPPLLKTPLFVLATKAQMKPVPFPHPDIFWGHGYGTLYNPQGQPIEIAWDEFQISNNRVQFQTTLALLALVAAVLLYQWDKRWFKN